MFWTKKRRKIKVSRGFHVCTKSLRKFTVYFQWYSNAQDSCLLRRTRCCNNKTDYFFEKKKQLLGRKNVKERCFSVFSDIAPLKSLVVLLHCSDYSQTNRIAGRSNLEGGKKIEAQNSVLFVFTFAIFSRVRQSWLWLRIISNNFPLSKTLLCCFDCAQAHSIAAELIAGVKTKKRQLYQKKNFWAEKLSKKVFLGGFNTIL